MPMRTPHERLAELAWLVGHWEETDEAADLSVHSEYSWARGGNFLTRNVTVKRAGETTLEGWQIIGWDPVEERIRSWTFDGEGGFAAGWWTREGDRWLLRETGITPDGSRHDAWNQRADQRQQARNDFQQNRDQRWNDLESAREDRQAWRDHNREDWQQHREDLWEYRGDRAEEIWDNAAISTTMSSMIVGGERGDGASAGLGRQLPRKSMVVVDARCLYCRGSFRGPGHT